MIEIYNKILFERNFVFQFWWCDFQILLFLFVRFYQSNRFIDVGGVFIQYAENAIISSVIGGIAWLIYSLCTVIYSTWMVIEISYLTQVLLCPCLWNVLVCFDIDYSILQSGIICILQTISLWHIYIQRLYNILEILLIYKTNQTYKPSFVSFVLHYRPVKMLRDLEKLMMRLLILFLFIMMIITQAVRQGNIHVFPIAYS